MEQDHDNPDTGPARAGLDPVDGASWPWPVAEGGDPRLPAAIYEMLREMAAARMAARQGDVLLQPTVLVNEALSRMLGSGAGYRDRVHFFALAALKMRAVLVDYARASVADKRGGGSVALTLSHVECDAGGSQTQEYRVLSLHRALERFAACDPRAARSVELSYFGGMTRDEIATVLEVSVPTVDRDLRIAKAWLRRELESGTEAE
ncbi:ECF-type sigma factor [Flavobacterium sp. MXW15]|uniref:ECF-type sigma factor n=1 Tax=Xanthomonas chitinilytica TaxID=2989819 RepID=A0ABT3JTG6_9XANT|nr:ECF-type sigma factor [Xanthomonas sp. H13-6]MCW4454552.1 ECF-type sigma factor [Flavobacterium sp. MXW15]MCW4471791.1 ECF-type sigma factor [Xanthomonas sp. H13-6]